MTKTLWAIVVVATLFGPTTLWMTAFTPWSTFVPLTAYALLTIGAIALARARGSRGIVVAFIAGGLGGILAALLILVLEPLAFDMLGVFLFPLLCFWGCLYGGVAGLTVWAFGLALEHLTSIRRTGNLSRMIAYFALVGALSLTTVVICEDLSGSGIRPSIQPLTEFVVHGGMARCLCLTDDSSRLAIGDTGGAITIAELGADGANRQRVLAQLDNPINTLAFFPDGRLLASGGEDKTVRLWHTDTGELLGTLECSAKPVSSIAVSSNGSLLAVGSGDFQLGAELTVWDLQTRRPIVQRRLQAAHLRSLAWSPDSQLLAVADYGWNEVLVLQAETLKTVKSLTGHLQTVRRVAFTRDGRSLVSADGGGVSAQVIVWDVDQWSQQRSFQTDIGTIQDISVLSQGSLFAIAGRDGKETWLWESKTGAKQRLLRGLRHRCVAMTSNRDGRRIAATDGKHIVVWDIVTWRVPVL